MLTYINGSPASDVVVRVERLSGGGNVETRTDRLGKFSFERLAPVQYHLIVRHPGYRDIEREVSLVFTGQEYVPLVLVTDPDAVGNKRQPTPSKSVIDASVPLEARKEFEKAETILASHKKDAATEALGHLLKAIEIHPTFLEAELKLGLAYMDLQQWDEAEQSLRRAIEINAKTVTAYLALGEIYLHQKKYAEAEKILTEGLVIDNRSWPCHFALGRIYYLKGDLSRAGKQIGLTIQLNNAFPDAHFLAGNIYLRVNNREFAREQFEEYLKLAPKGEFAVQARQALDKLKQ
jgi:Tfp pilus assembly protein PilF